MQRDERGRFVKKASKGIGLTPVKQKEPIKFNVDQTDLANLVEASKSIIGTSVNNKMAESSIAAEKPLLQSVTVLDKPIYGNYRAKIQGEQAAAQLRSAAAQPLTSDGALQQNLRLQAELKGQELINTGNQEDDT